MKYQVVVANVTSHAWNGFAAASSVSIIKPEKALSPYRLLGWDQHDNPLHIELTFEALHKAVIYGYIRIL